ncbi:MAG: hypothetical protein BWY81_01074 [Firmicutes bacterium ADurb.Bin467]|nr:MAG: hypothetical protein BWY81_01074 [Firmicutes bacterium ADurb.Bin467]
MPAGNFRSRASRQIARTSSQSYRMSMRTLPAPNFAKLPEARSPGEMWNQSAYIALCGVVMTIASGFASNTNRAASRKASIVR